MASASTDTYFLLDTNIVSDLMRHPQGAVAARIAAVGEKHVGISVVVAAELRFGVKKSGSRRLQTRLKALLPVLDVLTLAPPVDAHYGDIRAHLERKGELIGPNDMLIAAHARALGRVMVTANLREFRRVPSLRVENWLQQGTD